MGVVGSAAAASPGAPEAVVVGGVDEEGRGREPSPHGTHRAEPYSRPKRWAHCEPLTRGIAGATWTAAVPVSAGMRTLPTGPQRTHFFGAKFFRTQK